MPTLGEELKRRREERDISLAAISEATRIGTRFLKAIEADNFSVLPGGIFTRSFIRAYARQVGMDEEEAIALYQQQVVGPEEPVAAESEETVQHPRVPWSKLLVPSGVLVVTVAIALGVLSLVSSNSGPPAGPSRPAAPASAPARPITPEPDAGLSQTSVMVDPGSGSLSLSVEATSGDCWLRYQIDEGDPASMMLKPGEARDLPPANKQITLIIGNRHNLRLRINNRQVNFPPNVPNFAARVEINRDNVGTFIDN